MTHDDDSFFSYIAVPGSFAEIAAIKRWFQNQSIARFRFIVDLEIEEKFLNLKELSDLYPGVKIISVVMNPWKRMLISYFMIDYHFKNKLSLPPVIQHIKFDETIDFKTYIKTFPYNEPVEGMWFTLGTPQIDWLVADDRKVDYVLKAENIEDDFNVIKHYFNSNSPLDFENTSPFVLPGDYRNFYDDETRKIISEIFKKDIETFEYDF